MSASLPNERSILIRNVSIRAPGSGGCKLERADISVRAGVIAAIEPEIASAEGVREIDAKGQLAIPGLINAHVHSPGNFMRGCLDGLPLEIFMLYEVPPLADGAGSARAAYLRTIIGALEMLRLGITAVMDDAFFVPKANAKTIDAVMAAYRDVGIRATVALDQPITLEYEKYPYLSEILPPHLKERMERAPRQSREEMGELYAHLISRWHGHADGRLAAAVSCSAPQRATVSYLEDLAGLSRSYNIPFLCHILETKTQRVLGSEKYGKSLVRYVHDVGVLEERMQVIHAIWVDDHDISLLAQSGCTVAHNPVCNLRLGSGVMPFRKLREAGIPICLGTDEATVDDTHNLWLTAKLAGMVHSLSDVDYRRWPAADEVLECVWRGGARAMRRPERLGELAVGAAADIALLDLNTDAFTPLNDISRQLVFAETGSSVRTTIVDGRVICENGRITTVDEAAIKAEVAELLTDFSSERSALVAGASELEPHYRAMYDRAMAQDVGLSRRL